jgi:hypothetical protein
VSDALHRARRTNGALALGALGVVFGDIGTSPLYALQSVFAAGGHAVRPTEADVYGVVSLVFWTITLIVSVKYVSFVMRADNDGEGGIMALITLLRRPQVPTRSTTSPSLGNPHWPNASTARRAQRGATRHRLLRHSLPRRQRNRSRCSHPSSSTHSRKIEARCVWFSVGAERVR